MVRSFEEIFPAFLTIVASVVLVAILVASSLLPSIESPISRETLLTQVGSIYGTIFALVLTLSLLPVQRASESWSPSVVRLFMRDSTTKWSFAFLGLACITCFVFLIPSLIWIPIHFILAGAILSLGVSFDLLRHYHEHIGKLLNPVHVIGALSEEAHAVIRRATLAASRTAKYEGASEAEVYTRFSSYDAYINERISDLGEIAKKAILRSETLVTRMAIQSISALVTRYLESRRSSILVFPGSVFGSTDSNVDSVLNYTCEVLSQVSRFSLNASDEQAAIKVSTAFKEIAVCAAKLHSDARRPAWAPLAHAPIHFAYECAKTSRAKGLDEVSFQSAMMFSRIVVETPKDIRITDIFIPVADGAFDVARYLYMQKSFILAEEVIGGQFEALKAMLIRDDIGFFDSFGYAIKKSKELLPLALANEQISSRIFSVKALGKVYGLINTASLGHLFLLSLNKYIQNIGAERQVITPYRLLAEISENLRDVARDHEVSESFLIFNITGLLKQMSDNVVEAKQYFGADEFGWGQLATEIQSALNFFSWAHYKKKALLPARMNESGEALVYIGLLFFRENRIDILFDCLRRIAAIVDSYCESTVDPDLHFVGDMYAHYWLVRKVLSAKGIGASALDGMLATKPKAMSDVKWAEAQEKIQRRRGQLDERFERGGYHDPQEAITLAGKIIAETSSPPEDGEA